jgi:hypothetical protein
MLVLCDFEPDDVVLLLWLSKLGYTGALVIGKGNVEKKLKWYAALKLTNWVVYRGMDLPSDEKECYPDFPAAGETVFPYPAEPLTPERFKSLIENNREVVSTKPIDEFLRMLPKDCVFPTTRFYGAMSFNFRSAVKEMNPDECAKRMIAMFPGYLLWLESFPAIGAANAGEFDFIKTPVLKALQYGWNKMLFDDQLVSLERRVNKEDPDMSAVRRSVKCLVQINRDIKRNCLVVDALLVPFITGQFEPRKVAFKGHGENGYPVFEPTEEGGLYQAYQVEGLRDTVVEFMETL